MYETIYVPLDNSVYANRAIGLAVEIAKLSGTKLIGSHVFSAGLRDIRFDSFNSDNSSISVQKSKTPSPIFEGKQKLLRNSYLSVMQEVCKKERLEFMGVTLEGRVWKELVRDIRQQQADLVIIGYHGTKELAGGSMGSVVNRVTRHIERDILIIKSKDDQKGEWILTGLDGSDRSWGAFLKALELAEEFRKKLFIAAVFEPSEQSSKLVSLNRMLAAKNKGLIHLDKQEQIHETLMGSGIKNLYQINLDQAHQLAKDHKVETRTCLLEGKPWTALLELSQEIKPWLSIFGRTGLDNDEDTELGSNTENLMNRLPFNILITVGREKQTWLEGHKITWSEKARKQVLNLHPEIKGLAFNTVQQYALQHGIKKITVQVLNKALDSQLIPKLLQMMGFQPALKSTSKSKKAMPTV